MQYFAIKSSHQLPLVIVDVFERKPKSPDKDGFTVRYMAAVNDEAAVGARIVIRALDGIMGSKTKAPGVYLSTYEEVREVYDSIVQDYGGLEPTYAAPTRVVCGVVALALLMAMCAIVVPATVFWLVVCAFKRQSGLLTMGETAVMWSIFDWRPLIRKLGRIALGK